MHWNLVIFTALCCVRQRGSGGGDVPGRYAHRDRGRAGQANVVLLRLPIDQGGSGKNISPVENSRTSMVRRSPTGWTGTRSVVVASKPCPRDAAANETTANSPRQSPTPWGCSPSGCRSLSHYIGRPTRQKPDSRL